MCGLCIVDRSVSMVILHNVGALFGVTTLVDVIVEVEVCQVWGSPALVVFRGAPEAVFLGNCEVDNAAA